MMQQEPRVFVVDDDRDVLRALERLLRSNGFRVESFTSPADFLDCPHDDGPACLVLDLCMPGLSGLDVQETLGRRGLTMPIIFLSGQADVPSTARAMREGAVDFLVKPVDERHLLDALARGIARAIDDVQRRRLELDTEERLARLTNREREVCHLVAQGLLNKQIASELGTSEKTVKVHRGRVMHKLEVDSVASLVRFLSNRQLPRRTV
jgi:FixJ family two-component response regulator